MRCDNCYQEMILKEKKPQHEIWECKNGDCAVSSVYVAQK